MVTWVFGAVMALTSLLGLVAAARAHDGMFHLFGMLLFLFGIAMIFSLIHKHAGQAPQRRDGA